MFQSQLCVTGLFIIFSVLSVRAQTNADTTCQSLSNLPPVNSTLLKGSWYEEIRAPAKESVSCVGFNVTLVNNQTEVNITSNYSPTKSGLVMSKFEYFNVNASVVNANAGINITHNNITVTYKIVRVDYNSSLVLCGYTNTTSFAMILARQRVVDTNWLMNLKANASQILPAFNSTTAGNITQSIHCKPNSASTSVPALATVFVAFYALLKFVY